MSELSSLEQLKKITTVVADTGDINGKVSFYLNKYKINFLFDQLYSYLISIYILFFNTNYHFNDLNYNIYPK